MKTHNTRAKGFTVVEILVALLIGLLSTYAVYNVYGKFERTNRANTAINDTQLTGLHSMFLLEQTIADAGSSMMHAKAFKVLEKTQSAGAIPPVMSGDAIMNYLSRSVYPLPVVILSQGTVPDRRDELFLFVGKSTHYLAPVSGAGTLNVGNNTFADQPVAFHQGDVLVQSNGGGWSAFRVTSASVGNANLVSLGGPLTEATGSVVNLGNATRYRFRLQADNALVMEQYAIGGNTPESSTIIANDVRVFAAQYGIDANGDNAIDTWVNGDNSGTTGSTVWSPAEVLAFESSRTAEEATRRIKAIKAIRVGMVVRVEEPEIDSERPTKTKEEQTSQPDLTLFESCEPANTCPAGITFQPSKVDPSDDARVYRYRKYEAVIPLRNVVWNPSNAYFLK